MTGKTNTTIITKFSRDQRREMSHQIACAVPKSSQGGIPIDAKSFGRMIPKLQVCAWLNDKLERLEGLSFDAQHDLIVLMVDELFERRLLRFDHAHTRATLETSFRHKHQKAQYKRRARALVKEFEAELAVEDAWQRHQDRAFKNRNKPQTVSSELAPE